MDSQFMSMYGKFVTSQTTSFSREDISIVVKSTQYWLILIINFQVRSSTLKKSTKRVWRHSTTSPWLQSWTTSFSVCMEDSPQKYKLLMILKRFVWTICTLKLKVLYFDAWIYWYPYQLYVSHLLNNLNHGRTFYVGNLI